MKTLYIVLVSIALSLSSQASESLSEISHILKYVETQHRTDAVGDGGKAYGILQIHKGAILDVNRYFGTYYTHQDAFDEVCSEEIFELYITMGIELYMKKYGVIPAEEQIVRMWNGGIYRGYRIKSTINYYCKYLEYKRFVCG